MTIRKTAVVVLFLAFATFFFYQMSKNLPRFQGSFRWEKVKIMNSSLSGSSDLDVYESIKNMTKIFQLAAGDECYFLKEEEWIWRDAKDPAFALAPVFCPNKGGGWAMIPRGR